VERLPSGQLAVNQKLSEAVDGLRLMHDDLYWEMVVSVVGKGSALAAPANRLALRLLESGLLLHWEAQAAHHQWDQAALARTHHVVQGPQPLALAHLAGVFALWAAALAVSAATLALEMYLSANVNHHQRGAR
jgi:hypothetical protein